MTTIYTGSLRLIEPGVGDASVKNAWGGLWNTNAGLIESAITGTTSVSLAGLATYTLTAANGAADQSRPMGIIFTGAPTAGACTVTIPSVVRLAYVKNASSGVVTITTGAGVPLVLSPNLLSVAEYVLPWVPYYCDGTNVVAAQAPQRGSFIWTTQVGTTTWTPGNGISLAKFTLNAFGGNGGNGSTTTGGGGGGGGGAVVAWVPIVSGDVFTITTSLSGYAAVVQCAAGDVTLLATGGSAGAGGGTGGGAGIGANTSTRTFLNALTYSGTVGQSGYYMNTPGGVYSAGGAGGNSGLGAAGFNGSVGPASGGFAVAASLAPGSGGGGAYGTGGTGGAGGPTLVTVEFQ